MHAHTLKQTYVHTYAYVCILYVPQDIHLYNREPYSVHGGTSHVDYPL